MKVCWAHSSPAQPVLWDRQSTLPSHQGVEHVHLLPVQLVELLGQTVEWGLVIVHILL